MLLTTAATGIGLRRWELLAWLGGALSLGLAAASGRLNVGDAPLLQPVWDWIRTNGSPLVEHWLFPAVVGLTSFLLACSYFTFKDLRRHEHTKVGDAPWPTGREMLRAAVPQLIIYPAANLFGWYAAPFYDALPAVAPTVPELVGGVITCLIVSDFLIYWEHRIMHRSRFLLRHVHSTHHKYRHPFSWAGGWVHPVEDAVVILCVVLPPVALGVHALTFWVFVFIWVAFLMEEHSGHNVWWSPYNWLPLAIGGGGAPHDPHHNTTASRNFGFVFLIWDQLFGSWVPLEEVAAIRRRRAAFDRAA